MGKKYYLLDTDEELFKITYFQPKSNESINYELFLNN